MSNCLVILICYLVFSLINTTGNILKDETHLDETSIDIVLGGIFTWLLILLNLFINLVKRNKHRK